MGEFELIRRIRDAAGGGEGTCLGIGDDAAILEIPAGLQAVVTTDTLNAGVHFFPDADAGDIGYKALAVNLSDLAAMGAAPRWALLSLSMPEFDMDFAGQLVDGLLGLAREHGVVLAGGDTCAGPLSVTVTAIGVVEAGRALTRAGARPGDLVVVSGTPGLAAAALRQLQAGAEPAAAAARALRRPAPRVVLGAALVGKASACIDISDGLLADLGHILDASACGATLEPDQLPVHEALAEYGDTRRWRLQLTGGDDYELCFTLPPDTASMLEGGRGAGEPALSVIGTVGRQAGVRCRTAAGELFDPGGAGYEHFT